MDTNMRIPSLAETLVGKFEYESNFQTATPSGNYFWYRKRQQVRDLIQRNIDTFTSVSRRDDKCRFVDIGCGDGLDIFLIRQLLKSHFPKCEYLGFDGSPVNYQICNLRKDHFSADDVHFKLLNLTQKLPLDDNSVEFAYCSEVIEHISEPEKFLNEIHRILKPKGFLILTTPNEPNIFQKAYWLPSAQARLEDLKRKLKGNPNIFLLNDESVSVYGHISCRRIPEWDKALEQQGLSLVDFRRGAIIYGGTEFHDQNFVLGMRFVLEELLDILPKRLTRSWSDELIALYQVSS
jgi:SAM-dependent methyltransferase